MNDVQFLKQMFNGYINCFHGFHWYKDMTYTDLTAEDISHFRELGLMLGYIAVREWGNHQEKRRDLVWLIKNPHHKWTIEPPFSGVFLHLEHEQDDDKCLPCINDPKNKLLHAAHLNDDRYLLGIFVWAKPGTWQACSNFVQSDPDYQDKKVLLIAGVGNSRNNVTGIHGTVWVDNRAYCRDGTWVLGPHGFWYAQFAGDWQQC